MYTPENDTNNTTPANGTNESPKAPAADPSYNPYLQEKVPALLLPIFCLEKVSREED